MAVSELEIEPDLDKAPPHIEGELLKQKSRAVLSKWQKLFFVVHRDKLQYYAKKEDYKSGKEPLNVVRLLRVKDITESVFNRVPKKHHINCGFTVIELLPRGEEVIYNLLAETPDLMRYWVHGLRYIRSYWSKLEVRDTVLSEEQEKKLLERILLEDDIEDDLVVVGEYTMDEDTLRQGSADWDSKLLSIPVHFADGTKSTVRVGVADLVSDLMEKVHDKLTSSASQVWVVDNEGKEISLNPTDSLLLYHPSAHQFFLVDPTHRVLVIFIGSIRKEFVATIVPVKITSNEVIEHSDIAPKLDINGIANRGLFLQKNEEELLFDSSECPCEALFLEGPDSKIERRPLGTLVIKNKTLNRGRSSKWLRQTIRGTRKPTIIGTSERTGATLLEEEEAQRRALDKVHQLRDGKIKPEPRPLPKKEIAETKPTTSPGTPPLPQKDNSDKQDLIRSQSDTRRIQSRSRAFIKKSMIDEPDEDRGHSPPSPRGSPIIIRRRSEPVKKKTKSSENESDEPVVPQVVDITVVPPTSGGDRSPLSRRNATRIARHENQESPPTKRGITTTTTIRQQASARWRTPPEVIPINESRSSGFGQVTTEDKTQNSSNNTIKEEEERLDQLFSVSFQEKEEKRLKEEIERQISASYVVNIESKQEEKPSEEEAVDEDVKTIDIAPPTNPLIINLDDLRQPLVPAEAIPTKTGQESKALAPVVIHKPSILKVILLQSQATPTSNPTQSRSLELISLSGVLLHCNKGVWQLQEGYNYHDPIPEDTEDQGELYTLPGGIRAIYNPTQLRWHVLPPLSALQSPSSDVSLDNFNPEILENSDAQKAILFSQRKRAIVTEIGSSFNDILQLFHNTKSTDEKKRIASDMTNEALGHMIRGRFCSAIASLLLDGVKLQRLGGLVQYDVWKIVNSFIQEGIDVTPSIYPTIEARVMKPIKAESRLNNNHMKFRSFICLTISRGLFLQWLTELPTQGDTIKKLYTKESFLYLVHSGDEFYHKLYDEILLSLQPMAFFPFQLSIDFEIKPPNEGGGGLSPRPGGSRSVSPAPSPLPSPSHSPTLKEAPSKVVMATGQRTVDATPTAIINPSHIPLHNEEDTTVPKATPTAKALLPTITVDSITTSGPSWLKKITSNLANLNVGGSLTGAPKASSRPSTPSPTPPQPSPVPAELPSQDEGWSVLALYDCAADDDDELSFKKGDTLLVKKKINSEWLLCQLGDTTGIVPTNFVQKLTQ